MSVPRPVTAVYHASSPRSRSRGQSDAGSSGHPHRRSRRSSTNPLPPGLIERLARALRRQRAFRIDQLAAIEARRVPTDPVRQEVDDALRAAARLVLADIDAALGRIESGSYGRCRRCGEAMSGQLLTELPTATWCESCHYNSAAHRTPDDEVQARASSGS